MLADTAMMAFSMSKVITAVAVLQLVERGALGLDDSISRHIPWQPYGLDVTVRQLLCHTAGIPNPLPLRWVHAAGNVQFDERARLDAILHRHSRVIAAPGARYAYSNIGYWLLGYIVEAASGTPFAQHVATHVATPLGGHTPAFGYQSPRGGSQACGYLERYSLLNLLKPWLIDRNLIGEPTGRWVALREFHADGPAYGGVIGTASSFARLLQDQLREHSALLGEETRALMQSQQSAGGARIPMTLGWHMGSLGRTPHFYKEGGGGGFHCMMRLYRDAGLGTVVMTNATSFNVSRWLDHADAALLHGS